MTGKVKSVCVDNPACVITLEGEHYVITDGHTGEVIKVKKVLFDLMVRDLRSIHEVK